MEIYLNEMVRYLVAQSWQIAVLTVAVAAATFALRHRSAHVRYLLWLIVVAKCLVPPLYMVPLHVLPPAVPDGIPDALLQPHWAADRSATSVPTSLEKSAAPVPQFTGPAPNLQTDGRRLSVSGWLAIIWVLGVGACTSMNLRRALRGRHWLRKNRRPLPEDMQVDTTDVLRAYGIRRLPRIWIVEGVGQPFVWGLVRGSIYVPPGFLTIESPEHRRDILAHELSHVIRFDAAVNTLQVIAQAVFWFHPFVWWANRRIRVEREKCCDETAIARLHTPAKDYCSAVVEALANIKKSTRRVPSLAVAGPIKNIEERIRAMLRPGRRFHTRPSVAVVTIVGLIALAAIPTTIVLAARADRRAPSINEDGIGGQASEQPRFAARTFNSEVAFDVFVQETCDSIFDQGYLGPLSRCIGRTPSAIPLEVPPCSIWWVEPLGPVKDWNALVREMSRNHIPALRLTRATDSDVEHLAGLTRLEHLDLSYTQITDVGLAHLRDLTGLQGLALTGTQITDAGLAEIKGLTGLRELILSRTKVTDAGLAELKDLTGLRRLDVSLSGITDAGLMTLDGLTGLQFLDLTGTETTDEGLAHVQGLTKLQHLLLQGKRITDAGLTYLKGLTELRRLECSEAPITDAGLAHLAGLHRLQVLLLSRAKVTGPGLEYLKGMTGLQALILFEVPVTDAGLEHLKDLAGLRQLYLVHAEITDAGLTHLTSLTGLEQLDLSHTAITDAGLENLKDMTRLAYLSLCDTRTTDAGLKHLQGLTQLRYLRRSGSQITETGMRQLMQSRRTSIGTD